MEYYKLLKNMIICLKIIQGRRNFIELSYSRQISYAHCSVKIMNKSQHSLLLQYEKKKLFEKMDVHIEKLCFLFLESFRKLSKKLQINFVAPFKSSAPLE